MRSKFFILGSLSAFFCVCFGAFGAHALKASISAERMAVYQTGVAYQMWHSLGLLVIALTEQHLPGFKLLSWAGWLMFLGILFFSGSLYLLVLLDKPQLGMLTPVGGVLFLLAWLFFFLSVNNKNKTSQRP